MINLFKQTFTPLSIILSFALQSNAAPHAVFNVEPEHHQAASRALEERLGAEHPLTRHFKEDILVLADRSQCTQEKLFAHTILSLASKHGLIKKYDHLSKSYSDGLYNIRKDDYSIKPQEEVMSILYQYIFDHYQDEDERSAKLEELRVIADGIIGQTHIRYDAWRQQRGPWATGVLDTFVCEILNIKTHEASGYAPNYWLRTDITTEDRETAFHALKSSGFLTTELETVRGYAYDPSFEVSAYLAAHDAVQTLVLGCGHFPLSAEKSEFEGREVQLLDIDLFHSIDGKKFEASCGYCPQAPHDGEMVMSAHWGDVPDVACDLKEQRVWDAIPDHRFDIIKEHSGAGLYTNLTILAEIARVLKPTGTLEIAYHHLDEGQNFWESRPDLPLGPVKALFPNVSYDPLQEVIKLTR